MMRTYDLRQQVGFVQLFRFLPMLLAGAFALTMGLQAQDTSTPAQPVGAAPAAAATPDAATTNAGSTTPVAGSMDSMNSLNDSSKLGNGDRVSYRVVEEQKDPVFLTVSDSGELDVPLVGRITAKGKTCKELAFELKPQLEKEYFYHATVIIGVETFSNAPKGSVFLEGQVNKQGAVEIPSNQNLTVSQAILIAGGLADFADRRKVKLVRKMGDGKTQTTIVDLVEILDKGHSEHDPVVQADDMIIVPQRLVNF